MIAARPPRETRGREVALWVVLSVLTIAMGCANEIGMRDARDAAGDTARSDAGAPDIDAPAGALDAPISQDASDAGPSDAGSLDAPTLPPIDTGPTCAPTRTACRGELECGPGPNGCPGGVLDCGPCGGAETWCAVLPDPPWLSRMRSCVNSVVAGHPEYLDPSMPCAASSPLVLDARAAEYVRDVAACVDGSGAVAIVDPNAPVNEIRVRAVGGDVADNYPVRVYSTGCTRQAYTSSCSPAGF